MVTACTVTGLFDALAGFHDAHPGVTITLIEDDSAALTGRVRAGMADLALIGAAGGPPPDLESWVIVSEGLAAAAAPGHPLLAGPAPAKLADLTDYPIVCLPPGTGVRAVLDQACAAHGVRLDIALEASAPGKIADLAARGLGVAVLSETMALAQQGGSHNGRLRSVPLGDIGIPALLALVWKPAPGPAAQAFVRHCRQAFRA
jgi:DNA-binding transcriptional LysR family regulator